MGTSRAPHLQYLPNLDAKVLSGRVEPLAARNLGARLLHRVIQRAKWRAARQPSCRQPLRGPRVPHTQSGSPCPLELVLHDGPW